MMLTDSRFGSSRARNRSVLTLRAFAVLGLLCWSTPDLSADTVTATWNRNSESNIAGYILSYGTQSGTYSTTINVGNVTTKQVTLSPGLRYYFVVQAYNTSSLVSPKSAEVFFDVGLVATGLPSPWRATDIGSPAVGGSATYASGTFTISGAGADIWGSADQFNFAYQTLTGDGEIVARVATLQNTSSWAKAGVMMRETLTATSRNAFASVTPGNGLAFQRRATTGGSTTITSGGTGTAPYWVRLVRQGSKFSAYRSTTGTSWTLIGSETIAMAATVYVGLAVTSHNVSTRATATFTNAAVFNLPSPWLATDIGSPAVGGSATYASGTFTISGAGADIWGSADQFHFAYRTLTGDGEIVARVATLQNTSSWAKAGVMMRETLTATSRNAFASVTPGNGLAFQRRATTGGSSTITSVGTGTAPYWVRLVRQGSKFSAYRSTTGTSWTLIGSQTIAMAATVYVGLAVTSHNVSTRATATFTNAAVVVATTTSLTSTSITTASLSMTSEDPTTRGAVATGATADTNFSVSEGTSKVSSPLVVPPADNDYDGDGKGDVTVFTRSTGLWSILQSSTQTALTATLGAIGDTPVPGDYDGDGKTDIAMYHPATGEWSSLLSRTNEVTSLTVSLGASGDIPVPGDYDGDALTDIAVYQSATGQWQILKSSTTYTTNLVTLWGASGDIPVPGDYDGDGKIDLAVYRPSAAQWRILQSSTDYTSNVTVAGGMSGDILVPADYDGDGRMDVATYRPSNGTWNVVQSSTNYSTSVVIPWGRSGDVPVPGDYDGDGKADLGLFRSGVWQIRLSGMNYTTSMSVSWGDSGDVPLP